MHFSPKLTDFFFLSIPIRHLTFIVSTARLFAEIYNIPYSEKVGRAQLSKQSSLCDYIVCNDRTLSYQDLSDEVVTRILSNVEIPTYRPSEKVRSFFYFHVLKNDLAFCLSDC